MSDAKTLQELADRQAITDLIHRYCRAVDRIDPELGYTIWNGDGIADYGPTIYQGTGRGVIKWICESHKHALYHFHPVTNITIELDGDRAGSETYIKQDSRHVQNGKLIHIEMWGRYIDEWSRHSGRWGLDKRVFLCDFNEQREGVTPYNDALRGRRDKEDASYVALRQKS